MIDRLRKHWFVALVIICGAVVGATWGVVRALVVEPLRQENAYLRDRVSEALADARSPEPSAVLPRTSLAIGQTAPTSDGACTIGLESIHADTAQMVVVIGSKPPWRTPATAGDNLQGSVPGAWYYFFILDVQDEVAVVSVYRVGEPDGL